ncbi:MAG: alpha/beta hydrolase [Paracoccaceae bacterium]
MSDQGFVNVNQTRIHYKRAGSGVPVVLIHSAGAGDLRDWEYSIFAEIAKTNEVIAFDRPGIGQSDLVEGVTDPSVQAATLKQATQALGIERPPILVGHSYGGLVALSWGLINPQDIAGIMTIAPVSHPLNEKIDPILPLLTKPVIGAIMAALVCKVLRKKALLESVTKSFAPQDIPADYMEKTGNTLLTSPSELRNIAREICGAVALLPEIAAKYPSLNAPVEVICGSEDKNMPPEIHGAPLAEALPQARYTLIEGVAHMPHYQSPEIVLAALARLTKTAQ